MVMMIMVMVIMVLVTLSTLVMMKDRKSLSRAVCFLLHYLSLEWMLFKWILLTLGTYSYNKTLSSPNPISHDTG